MKMKRRNKVPSDLFLGSMADVTFLLVIFFMVTSVLSVAKGLDLSLPEKNNAPDFDHEEAIDVHVLANGSVEVDRQSMPISQILTYIAPVLEVAPKKPVILRTDPNASYGAMMVVLDELRQSPEKFGFTIHNLAIPTFSEQQNFW